jgi:hypothetical protein
MLTLMDELTKEALTVYPARRICSNVVLGWRCQAQSDTWAGSPEGSRNVVTSHDTKGAPALLLTGSSWTASEKVLGNTRVNRGSGRLTTPQIRPT